MKKLGPILLVVVLLLSMVTPMAFAEGGEASGRVDSILIKMSDGTIVSITMTQYISLHRSGEGTLYNFLMDGNNRLDVHGIVSGDKYITMGNYIAAFRGNYSVVTAAIESAEAIPENIVETFMIVESVNEETGEVILAPINGEQEPIVDKSALVSKIEEAEALVEADYTADTWAPFVQALETARTVNLNDEATQVEVDEALEVLAAAIDGLEQKPVPSIVATIKRDFIGNFGPVSIQVSNLPNAARFKVKYYVEDTSLGEAVLTETEIYDIGQPTKSIFYDPAKYRTVTIEIFNETDLTNPIHTFNDVELIVIPFGAN